MEKLDQISEEAGSDDSLSRRGFKGSHGSLQVPTSPTSSLTSSSPQMAKKRRMAQSRRSRGRRSDTDPELGGGAGEGAGVAAEGEENVSVNNIT